MEADYLKDNTEHEISTRASRATAEAERKLEQKYQAALGGALLYGLLATVLTASKSEAFVTDFKAFFVGIWSFLSTAFLKLLEATRKPFSGVESSIIQQALPFVITIVVFALVAFFLFIAVRKLFEFYTEYDYTGFADSQSLAELLISLAVIVWFAEPIRTALPVNLLLLLLLAHAVFIAIRWYIKKRRGY